MHVENQTKAIDGKKSAQWPSQRNAPSAQGQTFQHRGEHAWQPDFSKEEMESLLSVLCGPLVLLAPAALRQGKSP